MIRDLHPHTNPQRADSPENVPERSRKLGYEPSEYPPGRVGQGLAALFLFIGLSAAGIALFLWGIGPAHPPLSAAQSAARFTSPAPPLEADPRAERLRLEMPDRDRLLGDRRGRRSIREAMRAVATQGWGEEQAPPSPAETARHRAEAAQ